MAARVCMKWARMCVQGGGAGRAAWACAMGSASVRSSQGGEPAMARGDSPTGRRALSQLHPQGLELCPRVSKPALSHVSARGRSERVTRGLRGRGTSTESGQSAGSPPSRARTAPQPLCRRALLLHVRSSGRAPGCVSVVGKGLGFREVCLCLRLRLSFAARSPKQQPAPR